ncbi:MAG: hypothetical protein HY747_12450 [Elusimicrobia bacterium]|nr:hypothetical protein [Elusimicrobiota bacterium]
MVVELVENPTNQKGGFWKKVKSTGHKGLAESLNLKTPALKTFIEGLNNAPYNAFRIVYDIPALNRALSKKGLPVYLRLSGDRFYPDSVSGDISDFEEMNAEAFYKPGEVIHDFKEPKNLPEALEYISEQDRRWGAMGSGPAPQSFGDGVGARGPGRLHWSRVTRQTNMIGHGVRSSFVTSQGEVTNEDLTPWPVKTLREILGAGKWSVAGSHIAPFRFRTPDDHEFRARSAGLEGFLYSKAEIEAYYGKGALLHHLQDYFNYVKALFSPVPGSEAFLQKLAEIEKTAKAPGLDSVPEALRSGSDLPEAAKEERLTNYLQETVRAMQDRLEEAGKDSAWIRTASIYEIFPRAYNRLKAGKNFFQSLDEEELRRIKDLGFDTIWPMGIFPIGQRGRLGTAGGSPYSIMNHKAVNPELGTEEDFGNFMQRAHKMGMKVILDMVPNHTSLDNVFLKEHPEAFIHKEVDPNLTDEQIEQMIKNGHYHYGKPAYFLLRTKSKAYLIHHGMCDSDLWQDTAQLDMSRPLARNYLSTVMKFWVKKFDVDGFRVDMAYLLLNSRYWDLWNDEIGQNRPSKEALEQAINAVKRVKPGVALIAESYHKQQEQGAVGFDVIYNKADDNTSMGQHGFYDAIQWRSAFGIREALRHVAFSSWQKASSLMLNFAGNHDEGNPKKTLGSFLRAALVITQLLPGPLLSYNGQETGWVGHFHGTADTKKMIPFDVPAKIAWEDTTKDHEFEKFFRKLLSVRSEHQELLRDGKMEVLEPKSASPIVAYVVRPSEHGSKGLLILANTSDAEAQGSFAIGESEAELKEIFTSHPHPALPPQGGGENEDLTHSIEAYGFRIYEITAKEPAQVPVLPKKESQTPVKTMLRGAAVAIPAALFGVGFLPSLANYYGAFASVAGWLANLTFLFFPWVQIVENFRNMRALKTGGEDAQKASQRLAGVSAASQLILVAGNLFNFPSFLASGSAVLIGNALLGAAGSLFILGQLAFSGHFSRAKWLAATITAAAAVLLAPLLLPHTAIVSGLGITATAIFAAFTIPQILKNQKALSAISRKSSDDPLTLPPLRRASGTEPGPEALAASPRYAGRGEKNVGNSKPIGEGSALEQLRGVKPLYLLVGMLGNLMLAPVFMVSGHWWNVIGNIIGIFGPLVILYQLVKAGLYSKKTLVLLAAGALAFFIITMGTSLLVPTAFWL